MKDEIDKIIANLKEKEREYNRCLGKLEQLETELKNAGLNSVDEAKHWLEKINTELDEKEALRESRLKEFKNKFGDLL